MPDNDPKTAIFLPQSTIAALREALSVSDTREDELRAEVAKWKEALDEAEDRVDEIEAIDEHDPRFFHPLIGRFSPFSSGIKRQQVKNAQALVEEATGRLAFARHALRTYLESLNAG